MESPVDSTALKARPTSTQTAAHSRIRWLTGRQGRRLREALLAYLFLLPAFLIVGLFGLFPILFAAFESTLRGLNQIVGPYTGLGNYVQAIGDLAYVLFFWVSAILVFLAGRGLVQAARLAFERREPFWSWLLPGVLIGSGLAALALFIFRLLPLVLDIPSQMRGRNNTAERFRELLLASFTDPGVQQALWSALIALALGLALFIILSRRYDRLTPPGHVVHNYAGPFIGATVMVIAAAALSWLTWVEIQKAYAEAAEAGNGLELWAHLLTISAGLLLLLIAWWLWDGAAHRESNLGMALRLAAAAMLLAGGWLLIGELPRAVAAGDRKWWLGVINTFWYSLGTIPAQLGVALLLAVLLFQDIRGKSLFRMIYFIPYIAPFVGTAAVFRIIFSGRPTAPANALITNLGGDPLAWLSSPTGLFQMILGDSVTLPDWAAGPSLALIVIMIYGVWTFVGFNTVIFMAGLGNIPRELYEAGAIDGGGRWALFRHITLPLLSPTLYFLTLYSVIGTFKAFNHIYVLRSAAALGTTDTASVVIFLTFKENVRYGYASALAILLLVIILMLTAVNNRLASNRVFYG
ncbi:MAG TPA: ABC transporter permease subunit [Caldilineaceae bacterium]|nr:ABC transporter permease subunit [Caldilineaceae bacterium]